MADNTIPKFETLEAAKAEATRLTKATGDIHSTRQVDGGFEVYMLGFDNPVGGVSLKEILRINAEATIPLERYQEEGCADRFGYLRDLAENHGVTIKQVLFAADLMGPEEDFDGLVTTLEDHPDLVGEC